MSAIAVNEQLVISAVRYALGRATYIVGVTADEVIRVWPDLTASARAVIERDIREQLLCWPGMECDDANWRRLLRRIEEGK